MMFNQQIRNLRYSGLKLCTTTSGEAEKNDFVKPWLSLGRAIVAQVFNLLYRRLSVCGTEDWLEAQRISRNQQIGNLRYSRLEVCATLGAIYLFAGTQFAFGSAQPGSLDGSFNPGTGVDQSVFALAIQPDGKIVIGGDFTTVNGTGRMRVARLNGDGSLDSGFDPGLGPNDLVNAIALQGDKIIISGYFTAVAGTNQGYIARLNNNGTLDTNFNAGTGADGPVLALAVQPDSRVLLGGTFGRINNISRTNIARLNSNGAVDMGFDPGSGVSSDAFSTVNTLALQSDGKVVIGGAFSLVNGSPRNNIARLNATGGLDSGFVPNVGVVGAGLLAGVNALALQSDGSILVGGDFTSVAGSPRTNIARVSAVGGLDLAFNPVAGTDFAISSLGVNNDGKIVISGFFTQVNGTARNYLARLDSLGGLDTAFDPGAGPSDAIYATAIQTNGRVVIGGGFLSYNGTPRHGIARVKGDISAMLFNLLRGEGTFAASVATEPGYSYVLQFKNELDENTWTSLPAVQGDGTVRTLSDPAATVAQRFYRVRLE